MNKNAILFAVAGILLIGGIGYIAMQNKPTATDIIPPAGNTTVSPEGVMEAGGTPSTSDEKEAPGEEDVVEITVESSPFKFSLTEIKVEEGDTVKLTLNNTQGLHDWVLEGYDGVATKQLKAGESETIEFVADKVGTFKYYCSVGNHRAQGMEGDFIVEE